MGSDVATTEAAHCAQRRLLWALALLADDAAPRRDRERAASEILRQGRRLALGCLLYGQGSAHRAWRGPDEDVNDAVQHLALVASTGEHRFKGTHPLQAVSWCRAILRNHLAAQTRRVRLHGDWQRLRQVHDDSQVHGTSRVEASVLLGQLEARARAHLLRTRQPARASSLHRAVCCYLDHVTGAPLGVQLRRWTRRQQGQDADHRADYHADHHARDRLYQYHRRGRRVLIELLEAV